MLFGVKMRPLWTKNENEKNAFNPLRNYTKLHAVYSILNIACFSNNYLHIPCLGQRTTVTI